MKKKLKQLEKDKKREIGQKLFNIREFGVPD